MFLVADQWKYRSRQTEFEEGRFEFGEGCKLWLCRSLINWKLIVGRISCYRLLLVFFAIIPM